jgi:hypothetical protein
LQANQSGMFFSSCVFYFSLKIATTFIANKKIGEKTVDKSILSTGKKFINVNSK